MNRKNQGLTLVEVLVSVAVLSILIVSIYTVFKSGMDAWSKSDTRLEIFQNARFVLDQLSRELPGTIIGEYAAGGAIFKIIDGDTGPDTLEFVTNFGDSLWAVKYDLSGTTLQRSYEENPPDLQTHSYYDPAVALSEMVSGINLECWNGSWDTGGWDSGAGTTLDALPEAVRITLTLVDSNNKTYPFETIVYLPNSR